MKTKNTLKKVGILTTVATILVTVITSATVFAASTSNSEYIKAVAADIKNCYSNGTMISSIDANRYNNYSGVYKFTQGSSKAKLPNGYTSNDEQKCQDLLNSLITAKGSIPSKMGDEAATLLTNLGYQTSGSSSSGKCLQFNYTVTSTTTTPTYGYGVPSTPITSTTVQPTPQICANLNADGTIADDKLEVVSHSGDISAISFNAKNGAVNVDCWYDLFNTDDGGCGDVSFTKGVTKWDDLVSNINNMIRSSSKGYSGNHTILGYSYKMNDDGPIQSDYGNISSTYTLSSNAADTAALYLVGTTNSDFDDSDRFSLYQNYLKDYYGADVMCGLTEEQATLRTGNNASYGGYTKIKFYDGSSVRSDCYAKVIKNSNKKVNCPDSSGKWSTECSASDILSWLASAPEGVTPAGDVNTTSGTDTGNPGSTPTENPGSGTAESGNATVSGSTTEDKCYEQAGSLGWIICPMIFGLKDHVESLYENTIMPYLQVHSSIVTQIGNGSSGNLYESWAFFRNMANIAVIILLLVIIFSQITGFGIDNYGIKRMLPKLIVVAIIVNISFIICGILVDISNIVGDNLYRIIEAQAQKIPIGDLNISGATNVIMAIVEFLIGAIGVTTAVFGILGQGWAIILPVLLMLLSVIISVVFLVVILGLRQAFIIVMIVISPLAFACMMLPNTEKWFKQYTSIFGALLLTYPSASLLIAGGEFAARLLLSSGEGIMTLIAGAALCIGPYFFIPTLVRNSMKGIGNLGNMVAGLGRNVSGRATRAVDRAVRSTQGFQNYQRNHAAWNARRHADSVLGERGVGRVINGRNAELTNAIRSNDLHQETEGRHKGQFYYTDKSGTKRYVSAARAANVRQALEVKNTGTGADLLGARSAISASTRLGGAGFSANLANTQNREDSQAIVDQEALLSALAPGSADANADAGMDTLRGQFEQQLQTRGGEGYDSAKFKALMNTMSRTDAGRAAMKAGLEKYGDQMQGRQIGDFTYQMGNALAGDVKKSARSLFDYANKGVIRDADGNITGMDKFSNYRAGGSKSKLGEKITASNFQSYDPGELEDALTAYNAAKASGASQADLDRDFGGIQQALYEAATDPRVHVSGEYQKYIGKAKTNADGSPALDGNGNQMYTGGLLDGYVPPLKVRNNGNKGGSGGNHGGGNGGSGNGGNGGNGGNSGNGGGGNTGGSPRQSINGGHGGGGSGSTGGTGGSDTDSSSPANLVDAPKTDAPKTETPRTETPKTDAPKGNSKPTETTQQNPTPTSNATGREGPGGFGPAPGAPGNGRMPMGTGLPVNGGPMGGGPGRGGPMGGPMGGPGGGFGGPMGGPGGGPGGFGGPGFGGPGGR